MAQYRMGWVVGYTMDQIVGDNIFLVEENYERKEVTRHGRVIWHPEHRVKIYQSAEVAQRVAEQKSADAIRTLGRDASPWFWRAWKYGTDNPDNAKGMPKWTPEDDVVHWVHQPKMQG